ncbi:MAG: ImmA/IrrE family metallo-endopeptidase [Enterococcus sp.]
MNDYERLLCQIQNEIPVLEASLQQYDSEGFYRNGKIFIEKSLSSKKKKEILAEEYGHYKTTVGTIIDYRSPESRKQECEARRYAIEKVLTLDDLLSCALNECHNKFECADFLNVTPDFIQEALNHYFNKYGATHFHRNYKFTFDTDFISVERIRKIG